MLTSDSRCDGTLEEVNSGKTEYLPPPRRLNLANPANAMVDKIFCVFQDVGIYCRLGDPELDLGLGRWW